MRERVVTNNEPSQYRTAAFELGGAVRCAAVRHGARSARHGAFSRIAHRAPRPVRRVCGAHIATRFLAKNADPAILPITFGLSGIGIAFVTRLAPNLAVSQIIWLFVGIACMVITLAVVRNIDRLSQYKYTFMVLGIILLLPP